MNLKQLFYLICLLGPYGLYAQNIPLTQSGIFSQCQIPQSYTPPPEMACKTAPNPQQPTPILNTIHAAIAQADSYIKELEKHEASASCNQTINIGLCCLEGALKQEEINLENNKTYIKNFLTEVEKSNEIFKKKLQSVLDEIKDSTGFLDGDPLGGTSDKFKSLFSENCQRAIGHSDIERHSASGGLNGIDELFNSIKPNTAKFSDGGKSEKRRLQRQIKDIQKVIRKRGIHAWINGTDSEDLSNYPQLGRYMQRKKNEADDDMRKIEKTLNETSGYKFSFENMESFSSKFPSRGAFKKFLVNKSVSQCVQQSLQEAINGLSHKSSKTKGLALKSYKQALTTIVNGDNYSNERIYNLLRSLDHNHRNKISLTHITPGGSTQKSLPSKFFEQKTKYCTAMASSTDISNANENPEGFRIEQALNQYTKAMDMHENISKDITNHINNNIMNCPDSSNSTDCNVQNADSIFNTQSPTFCITKAVKCAAQVNSCQRDVQTKKKQFKEQKAQAAKKYNAMVSKLHKVQEIKLEQVKGEVLALFKKAAEVTKTPFKWSQGLFIKSRPSRMHPDFKIKLTGVDSNGEIDDAIFQELSRNVNEKILVKLQENGEAALGKMQEHIEIQRASWEQEMGKWDNFKRMCENMIEKFHQGQAQMAEQKSEAFKKRNEYCDTFKPLPHNPAAGCDPAILGKLISGGSEIIPHLTPNGNNDDIKIVEHDYPAFCAGVQKEGILVESEGEDPVSNIQYFSNQCMHAGGWGRIKKNLEENDLMPNLVSFNANDPS